MLDFLRRYQVPVSSGLLLLLATMLISANARGTGRVDPLARVILSVVYPFQLAVSRVTGGLSTVWSGYIDLVGARAEARGGIRGEVARKGDTGLDFVHGIRVRNSDLRAAELPVRPRFAEQRSIRMTGAASQQLHEISSVCHPVDGRRAAGRSGPRGLHHGRGGQCLVTRERVVRDTSREKHEERQARRPRDRSVRGLSAGHEQASLMLVHC